MRTTRVYVAQLPRSLKVGDEFELPKNAAHHIATVLRAKPGASIELFDGQGFALGGTLLKANRHTASVQIESCDSIQQPVAPKIIAAFAIARGDRMDFALQKATELGADSIQPLISERTVVRLKVDGSERKLAHWQSVAISACEQCGRAFLPAVEQPVALTDWLAQTAAALANESTLGLLLAPDSASTLPQIARRHARPEEIYLLSGPEGGFSESEQQAALAAGFVSVKMGPRVLRAETAVVTGLSCAQLLWGDLGASDDVDDISLEPPVGAARSDR